MKWGPKGRILILIDHGHTVILKPFDQKALNWLNFHQKSGDKFYFCLTLTWNSTIWVFHNAYSLAWALRMLDGIFKDLNDRWLNLSGSKSTQRCVSFSWKFRRKIELIFCPKLSAQFQYMYLTKQCQVCFKIWSPLHVFRELKATTYFPDTTVNQN
jgi:hypothetical protein